MEGLSLEDECINATEGTSQEPGIFSGEVRSEETKNIEAVELGATPTPRGEISMAAFTEVIERLMKKGEEEARRRNEEMKNELKEDAKKMMARMDRMEEELKEDAKQREENMVRRMEAMEKRADLREKEARAREENMSQRIEANQARIGQVEATVAELAEDNADQEARLRAMEAAWSKEVALTVEKFEQIDNRGELTEHRISQVEAQIKTIRTRVAEAQERSRVETEKWRTELEQFDRYIDHKLTKGLMNSEERLQELQEARATAEKKEGAPVVPVPLKRKCAEEVGVEVTSVSHATTTPERPAQVCRALRRLVSGMWPLFVLWNAGLTNVIVPTLTVVSLFATTVFIIRQFTKEVHIPIRDATKQHNWLSARLLERALYCSICESLMMAGDGVFCDCCGVCADSGCIRTADRKLRCKMIAGVDKGKWKHHWVKGNLPLGAVCEVCDEECGSEPGLVDFQCCWCQRTVHLACQQSLGEVCDFGPFRNLIIPPTCVTLKKLSRMRSKLQLRSVSVPNWENWTPVIVLANRKSGSGDGERVLSRFRSKLNPAQVVDLADWPPEAALEWCTLLGNVQTNVLVAGGDGTVGWVLTTIHNLNIQPVPRVALIPLGTGNDLSRVLGWGADYNPESDPSTVLRKVIDAYPVPLDRWSVEVRSYRHIRFRSHPHQLFMYNYISFGVDAQVALDFHRTRESRFYVFSNRLFNKMLYLLYGTQQVMERGCQGLEQRIEVYLDGKLAELPSIESVVVLNIPSWGGGVQLWNMLDDPPAPQKISDGHLEVLAIFSSIHIGQLQVGLSQPHVIGQANHVQIKLKARTPVEVDGEPWSQHPAEINISCRNQAVMLQSDI